MIAPHKWAESLLCLETKLEGLFLTSKDIYHLHYAMHCTISDFNFDHSAVSTA